MSPLIAGHAAAQAAPSPMSTSTSTASSSSIVQARDSAHVFWSGHSLMDQPIPDYVASIAQSLNTPLKWNRQYVVGSSLEVRTRGRTPGETGWPGYRQGYNRDTENMDVVAELREPRTLGGDRYDALIITEVHTLLWAMLRADSVRLLRHYHDRFVEGNPNGRTFFYESWLNVNDKSDPRSWIEYERAASPIWQCAATRVNTSLAAQGQPQRIASLPAGLALAELVDRATTGTGLPGVSGATVRETVDRIVKDNVHLWELGSYYVALVTYAFVYDRSPIGAWAPPEHVNATQARALQEVAWDFAASYRRDNRPLTLAQCSAEIRDRFAEHYWRYVFDGYRRPDDQAVVALMKRAKHTAQRMRNVYEWRKGFADDAADNPLRYDPSADAQYWHPAP